MSRISKILGWLGIKAYPAPTTAAHRVSPRAADALAEVRQAASTKQRIPQLHTPIASRYAPQALPWVDSQAAGPYGGVGWVPEEPWTEPKRWQPSDGYVGCGDDEPGSAGAEAQARIDDTYCTPDRGAFGVSQYPAWTSAANRPEPEASWWTPPAADATPQPSASPSVDSGWPTPDPGVSGAEW